MKIEDACFALKSAPPHAVILNGVSPRAQAGGETQ